MMVAHNRARAIIIAHAQTVGPTLVRLFGATESSESSSGGALCSTGALRLVSAVLAVRADIALARTAVYELAALFNPEAVNTDATRGLVAAGAPVFLLEVARAHRNDATVQHHAMCGMARVARTDIAACRAVAVAWTPLLADALRRHAANASVCCNAMATLSYLCAADVGVTGCFLDCDGSRLIVDVMRTYPGNADAQAHCAGAVQSLVAAEPSEAARTFLDAGCATLLMAAARTHPNDACVQMFVANAVARLIMAHCVSFRESALAWVAVFAHMLQRHRGDCSTCIDATSALLVLWKGDHALVGVFLADDGARLIADCMAAHPASALMQSNAALVASVLMRHGPQGTADALADAGAPARLLAAAVAHPNDARLVSDVVTATSALNNATGRVDAAAWTPVLLDALRRHTGVVIACESILCLLAHCFAAVNAAAAAAAAATTTDHFVGTADTARLLVDTMRAHTGQLLLQIAASSVASSLVSRTHVPVGVLHALRRGGIVPLLATLVHTCVTSRLGNVLAYVRTVVVALSRVDIAALSEFRDAWVALERAAGVEFCAHAGCPASAGAPPAAVLRAALERVRVRATVHACARCRLVAYCTRACQRADWARHRAFCRLPCAGDALAQCAAPGCTRVRLLEPADEPLQPCARCDLVRYCSRACQRAHWNAPDAAASHRAVCRARLMWTV